MNNDYQCKVGRSRRRTPASNPDRLLSDWRDDDGRQSEPLYYENGWPVLACPDCSARRRTHPVQWHEAGFVPGTRLCSYCGSFWELTTLAAVANEEGQRGRIEASMWFLRRARFFGGRR